MIPNDPNEDYYRQYWLDYISEETEDLERDADGMPSDMYYAAKLQWLYERVSAAEENVCQHQPEQSETHDLVNGRWCRIVVTRCRICLAELGAPQFEDVGDPPADWLVELHNPIEDEDDPDFGAPWRQRP